MNISPFLATKPDAFRIFAEAVARAQVSAALATPAADYLDGIDAIAAFLTETLGRTWTSRQVRYARERGSLPIRQKETLGVYAFRSELLAALKGPDSLPQTAGGRA